MISSSVMIAGIQCMLASGLIALHVKTCSASDQPRECSLAIVLITLVHLLSLLAGTEPC